MGFRLRGVFKSELLGPSWKTHQCRFCTLRSYNQWKISPIQSTAKLPRWQWTLSLLEVYRSMVTNLSRRCFSILPVVHINFCATDTLVSSCSILQVGHLRTSSGEKISDTLQIILNPNYCQQMFARIFFLCVLKGLAAPKAHKMENM